MRVPMETKESYRWLESLRQSIALGGAPERCVHVGDWDATCRVGTRCAGRNRQGSRW